MSNWLKYLVLILVHIFTIKHAYAQKSSFGDINKLDSLFAELKLNQTDTTLIKINYRIGYCYSHNGIEDTALVFFNKAFELSLKSNFNRMCIKSNKEIGFLYYEIGEMDSCIKYFKKAISFIQFDTPDNFDIYTGLGTVYFFKGDNIKCYENYLKSLKLAELSGKQKMIARACGNVGVALKEQLKLDDALIFFTKTLDIAKKNDLKAQTYVALTNIGNIYSDKFDKSKSKYELKNALNYYLEAKEIVMPLTENDQDRSNAVTLLGNIGNIYADMNDLQKALESFKEALVLMKQGVFLGSKSMIYTNLATVYIELKNATEAEKYLKLSREAALESESPSDLMENYKSFSALYEINGDYKNAYLFHYRYKKLSDSLFSTEVAEKRKEIELNAEYEKKEAIDKEKQDKKEAIAKEEKNRQLLFRNASILGFVLMGVVAFLIFRGYRVKQKSNEIITKQKEEVEKQKELVEEKQKEILDSIHYAKRIQQSLLPTDKYIEKRFENLKKK